MKPKIKHRKLDPKKAPELAQLAEQVGQFIEYWGFKSVQGRLWLYLFVSKEPLSSIELSDLLGVSPALVTQSVQVLMEYRVILPAPKGANGVLRYEANRNVAEAIQRVLESRESKLLKATDQQLLRVKRELKGDAVPGFSVNRESLEQMSGWLGLFQEMLGLGIASLKAESTPFSDPSSFLKKMDGLDDWK